jgi:hypothetical protein
MRKKLNILESRIDFEELNVSKKINFFCKQNILMEDGLIGCLRFSFHNYICCTPVVTIS